MITNKLNLFIEASLLDLHIKPFFQKVSMILKVDSVIFVPHMFWDLIIDFHSVLHLLEEKKQDHLFKAT